MKIDDIKFLCNAIYFWLNYHHLVSYSDILLESSIRFPFTEFLERKYGSVKTIVLEHPHPEFKKRRIDFLLKESKDSELKDDGEYVFFEMKYIKGDSQDIQKYYNDIIRLAFLKYRYKNSQCFFVCCGDSKWFKHDEEKTGQHYEYKFKSQIPSEHKRKFEKKKDYTKWLSFDIQNNSKSKRITIDEKDDEYITSFKKEYNDTITIPFNEVKTELFAIRGNKEINNQAVAIWSISVRSDLQSDRNEYQHFQCEKTTSSK